MTTHTPAPWHVTRYNDLQYSISNRENGYDERHIKDAEDEANAALIEAAPELLEMVNALAHSLEEAVHLTDKTKHYNFRWQEEIKAAYVIMSKATGE